MGIWWRSWVDGFADPLGHSIFPVNNVSSVQNRGMKTTSFGADARGDNVVPPGKLAAIYQWIRKEFALQCGI